MEDIQINKVFELESLRGYYQLLNQLAEEKSDLRIMNDSPVHATIVMRVLLDHSSEVNMYCGIFSIFRECFREKVKTYFEENFSDEEKKSLQGEPFDPFGDLHRSLKSFLKRGGKLQVVMEKEYESLNGDVVYTDILKPYIDKGQAEFYHLEAKPEYDHFTIGDNNKYRRESDKELRLAICCFNNEEGVNILKNSFSQLLQNSSPICFN